MVSDSVRKKADRILEHDGVLHNYSSENTEDFLVVSCHRDRIEDATRILNAAEKLQEDGLTPGQIIDVHPRLLYWVKYLKNRDTWFCTCKYYQVSIGYPHKWDDTNWKKEEPKVCSHVLACMMYLLRDKDD